MKKLFLLSLLTIFSVGFVFAGTISVTNPAAGAEIDRGTVVTITWIATDTSNMFKITLWKGGSNIATIADNVPAGNGTRTHAWTTPLSSCDSGYSIKVKEKGGTGVSGNSGEFSIVGCPSDRIDWERLKAILAGLKEIKWWKDPRPEPCLSCPPIFDMTRIREILIKYGVKEEIAVEFMKNGELFGKAGVMNLRKFRGKRMVKASRGMKLQGFSKLKNKALLEGTGFTMVLRNAKGQVVAEIATNLKQRMR